MSRPDAGNPWRALAPWSGVDADDVASVGRALAAAADAVREIGAWLVPRGAEPWWTGWQGPAATAAGTDRGLLIAALAAVAASLGDAAAALAVLADAVAEATGLLAAAEAVSADTGVAVVGATLAVGPAALDPVAAVYGLRAARRLLADADALVLAADGRCATRLAELAGCARPVRELPVRLPALAALGHLAAPADPERQALDSLRQGGRCPRAGDLALALGAWAPRQVAAAGGRQAAPPAARLLAGRLAMAADGPTDPALTALLGPRPDGSPRRFLAYERHGAIAEVIGDVATARDVVVYVPGTSTSLRQWAYTEADLDALAATTREWSGGASVAVVAWLGSPEPPDIPHAVLQSYAKAAAPRLRDFVAGLGLAAGARLTVVGHSYGGTVAGLAVRDGLRPDALVAVATPGLGPKVHRAADLHSPDTVVYALTDPRDPILDVDLAQRGIRRLLGPVGDRLAGAAGIGHLGDDPTCLPGVQRLSTGDDLVAPPWLSMAGAVHTGYFVPGRLSLDQLAAVAAGRLPVPYAGRPCG